MPKLKRCSVVKEEITAGNDVEESCTAAADSENTNKTANRCYTVPVVQLEGHGIDLSNYCSSSGILMDNAKGNSVPPREAKNKPPLLKSSRGRKQVLPMKFNDSVLHSWKKEKSECCDDLKGENNEFGQDVPRKKLKRETSSSASYDDIYLVKKPQFGRPMGFQLKNIILEPYSSSRSSVTSVNEGVSCVSPSTESGGKMNVHAGPAKPENEEVLGKKPDFYEPGDFVHGDIVWAKCGKHYPAWPAIVIDPLWQAPEAVLKACVADTLCVMFYGYSRSGLRVISSLILRRHS